MGKEEDLRKWQQIVAKAWMDDAFKKRLLAQPAAVLKEGGIQIPGGVEVRVVENSDKVLHFVLPDKSMGELPEEQLDKVAGGCGTDKGPSWLNSPRAETRA